MNDDDPRTRESRTAAECALVRVVHHYGERPEFVVLGGLVPDLLCSTTELEHTGTTDVDVQVNLEIAGGAVNGAKLERALRNAEFESEDGLIWRWSTAVDQPSMVVTFELLADLDTAPNEARIEFDTAPALGAVNLRGSRFAAQDSQVRELTATVGEDVRQVEVKFAGLAGFLLAKNAAAYSRRKPKDWYDIAFVLLNNDAGGPIAAAQIVEDRFGDEIVGSTETALRELAANFADHRAQGTRAYVNQMTSNYPDQDPERLGADAITAVDEFCSQLTY